MLLASVRYIVRTWVTPDLGASGSVRRVIIPVIAQLLPAEIAPFITSLETPMTTTASDPQIVPRPPTAAWTTLSCVTSTTARSTTPTSGSMCHPADRAQCRARPAAAAVLTRAWSEGVKSGNGCPGRPQIGLPVSLLHPNGRACVEQ